MNVCAFCGTFFGNGDCPTCKPAPNKQRCALCGGTFNGGGAYCAGCALLGAAPPPLGNVTLGPAIPKDGDIALAEPRPAYKPNPFMKGLRDW